MAAQDNRRLTLIKATLKREPFERIEQSNRKFEIRGSDNLFECGRHFAAGLAIYGSTEGALRHRC